MGTYLYALRSPRLVRRCVVALYTGKRAILTLGSLSFVDKPSWGGVHRSASLTLGKLESLWGDRPHPFAVAHTDDDNGSRIAVGDQVLIPRLSDDDLTQRPRTRWGLSRSDGAGYLGRPIGIVVAMESRGKLDRNAPIPADLVRHYEAVTKQMTDERIERGRKRRKWAQLQAEAKALGVSVIRSGIVAPSFTVYQSHRCVAECKSLDELARVLDGVGVGP